MVTGMEMWKDITIKYMKFHHRKLDWTHGRGRTFMIKYINLQEK